MSDNTKKEDLTTEEKVTNSEKQEDAIPEQEELKQKEIEKLQKDLEEEKKKYLYLLAEFDNYKKRAIKERSDLLKYGIENISKDMLHVVDNLERAVFHAEKITTENPNAAPEIVSGIKITITQFLNTFKRFGITPFESLDAPFDPNVHEAIGICPIKDKAPNLVHEEHQKGYKIHDRLLRPARVIVTSEIKENK